MHSRRHAKHKRPVMHDDFEDGDYILAKLHEAENALENGHSSKGVHLAKDALRCAEESPEMTIENGIDLRRKVVTMYMRYKLFREAERLTFDVEQNLEYLSDEDTRTTFKGENDVLKRELRKILGSSECSGPLRQKGSLQASPETYSKQVQSDNPPRVDGSADDIPLAWSSRRATALRRTSSTTAVTSLEVPSSPERICRTRSAAAASGTGARQNSTVWDTKAEKACPIPQRSSQPQIQPKVGEYQPSDGQLLASTHTADNWFKALERDTLPFIRGPGNMFQNTNYKRIRVAILDTGLGSDAEKPLMQSFSAKIKKQVSCFPDDARTGFKGELHGINVMYQLSRVCPNAWLYSYRVKREEEELPDEEAVVSALAQCKVDKIDIVNMSFGWPHRPLAVRKALQAAAQDAEILLFASVSNSGALSSANMLFPATHTSVFAVDAAEKYGNPAPFNAAGNTSEKNIRYTAPGMELKGVSVPGQGEQHLIEGTSFASPIVAGIAALILEFAKQGKLGETRALNFLKTQEGMERIFAEMGIQKTSDRFLFLTPWRLFKDLSGNCGGNGEAGSRRYAVAGDIVYKLRELFDMKEKIGCEHWQ